MAKIKVNDKHTNLNFAIIAASIITDFNLEYFTTETKTEVAKIFHNLNDNCFFSVDCFEHSHLDRIKNHPNYRFVGSFYAHPNPHYNDASPDAKFLQMLGSETAEMFKNYLNKFNVDSTLSYFVQKENLGYYQTDLQAILELFKESVDNLDARTFKYFNAVLSQRHLQNNMKSFIIYKEIENHIKNFNLKFFCYRMRSQFSNDSAIKVEFANAMQNYIVGKL